MPVIKDGATGDTAKVDNIRRLHVFAVNKDESLQATADADAYTINSGLITLTTAGESGILYVKNNEDRDLHITGFVAILGPAANGSATDTTHVRIYKNPTTGTLISTATTADVESNRNFGSSKTLTADSFKGAEAETITNGTVHIESLISPGNRVVFDIDEILTKGDSVAISYEPPDSTTSMKCMADIICHLENTAN